MGGAGGHMRHPHDLNEVESGKDIIALFRAIPAYLKSEEFQGGETSSLKLDGSNNGLRLVYRDGKYQFAIDRGSMKALDVQGVTADQLEDRFPGKVVADVETGEETLKSHGMVASSNLLLKMMNEPLEEDHDEMFSVLKELGFLVEKDGRLMPDPTKYISIEYVERVKFDHPDNPELGKANVIYYPFDFIAFHGMSEFFEMVAKRTGEVVRQGPKATPEDSGPGKPIPYNRAALDKLIEIVTPYAPEGFRVFGPVSLKVAAAAGEEVTGEESEVAVEHALERLSEHIEQALNTNISIRTSADPNMPPLTMTLEEWLTKAQNFNYKPDIKIVQTIGDREKIRKVSPFHKDIHAALIKDKVSVPDLVVDPEIGDEECDLSGNLYDCEKAIYGAIFMEAARILGNTVKESLAAAVEEFGPAVSQEGVVIDAGMPFGKKKTGHAFKITGEFIVDASGGAYATKRAEKAPALREEEFEVVEDEDEDPVVDSEFTPPKTIALVAGAFKPPHQGHVQMVKKYATKADEVVILISNPLKKQRSIEVGGKERNITAKDSKKIWEILLSDLGLENIEVKISPKASPVQAVFEEVGKSSTLPQGTHVILGASSKPDISGIPDWQRYLDLVRNKEKHVRPDLVIEDLETNAVEPHVKPDGTAYSAGDFRDLLTACSVSGDLEGLTTFSGCPVKTQMILDILGIETKKPVDEASSMSGGGMAFSPLSTSGKKKPGKRDKKKKPSMIRQENTDLSLVEEVLELIIGRGVYYE
jgi:hypothetical protein